MQLGFAPPFAEDRLLQHNGQNAAAGDGRARARKTQPTFSSFPGFTTRCHRKSNIAGPAQLSRMGFWGAGRSSSRRRTGSIFPASASVALAGLCLSAEPLEKPSPGIQGSMDIEMQLKPFFPSAWLSRPLGPSQEGAARHPFSKGPRCHAGTRGTYSNMVPSNKSDKQGLYRHFLFFWSGKERSRGRTRGRPTAAEQHTKACNERGASKSS